MSASTPSSVIIVGSGVFGLGTAYEIAQRWENTNITVLDRLPFPAADGSSIDSSRESEYDTSLSLHRLTPFIGIIRADYADLAYAKLMAQAMPAWRGEFGKEGRYTQSGLALISDEHDGASAQEFLKDALANVTGALGLKLGRKQDGGEVTVFDKARDAIPVISDRLANSKGYVNWTSGWAHAADGVKFMRKKVEALGRVNFEIVEVKRLLFKDAVVEGVELADGSSLTADLTILATGAWTPKLIDLRGIASATGQVLTYLDISEEEERRFSQQGQPVILFENDGMFIIPPRDRVLKVARHGYGYSNPTTIPHPEKPNETITVSLPRTKTSDPNLEIPPEGNKACREFLQKAIPELGSRPFSSTRLCWYTDTPTGDWLITYHPKYKGLFVATGGSGHGYKFLPIIGERIVDVLEGVDRDDLGTELRQRWKWPKERLEADHVWTNDWRGEGVKGMTLDAEYAKTTTEITPKL